MVVTLPLFELTGQFGHGWFVRREDGVGRKVNIVVWSNAAQYMGNVVDNGLTTVVQAGFVQLPGLAMSNHGVELVDGGNEDKLGVFEDLGITIVSCVSHVLLQ